MTSISVFQQKLKERLPGAMLKFEEPLSAHTSFRVGGPAEVMAFPDSRDALAELLKTSSLLNVKPIILGAGTNVLAPDRGIDGLVICLKDCLDGIEIVGETCVRVMGGVTMSRAAIFAANHGLSGMEFAHGIPGTVGGGVYMNAGAYGGEICQICREVEVMNLDGEIRTYAAEEMMFSYRHSILEDTGGIVVSALFELTKGDPEEIRGKMKELMAKRSASQPLELPSAGSAFKRPVGGFAAALIDQSGLKGFQVGGAGISVKHAGFAVNLGGATAEDVKELLKRVSDIVFEKHGIRLQPEIRIW